LPLKTILLRAGRFFGWMLFFLASMSLIGLIPTVPIFIVALMRVEGPEKWRVAIPMAVIMTVFIYFVFNDLLAIQWPQTVVGDMFPILKAYIPSM